MCYLVLIVTASFTPYWRCAILIILLCWSVYWGDLLAEIPFYTGALLADMSILLSKANNSIATGGATSRFHRINKYWPMSLGIFGLFLCSYPTNNAQLAGWSRAMILIGQMIFNPQCIPPHPPFLIPRGTPMGLLLRRLRNPNLRNPLLSLPSPHVLTPLRSLLRQHLFPRLPHPRLSNAVRPSLGDLRNDP
jgi:hypothetical protein